jgi:hypothetical protein
VSYYSVKYRIDRALKPSPKTGKVTMTTQEFFGILTEAKKDGVNVAEARLLGTLFSKAYVGKRPADAPPDAFLLNKPSQKLYHQFAWERGFARGPAIDLGYLTPPGPKLNGKTFEVPAGDALRFDVVVSKRANLGGLASPTHPGLIKVTAGVREKRVGDDLSFYSLRVSPNAPKGTLITVRSNPLQYSVRTPDWLFEFKVRVV